MSVKLEMDEVNVTIECLTPGTSKEKDHSENASSNEGRIKVYMYK